MLPVNLTRKQIIAGVVGGMLIALPALAIQIVPPECATGEAPVESCGLAQLIGVFVRVAQFIFGIAGSIALAMFVYGGFVWLTSAGNPDRIQKGKMILIQTIIALAVIFGGYTGVQFLVGALRGGAPGGAALLEGESCTGANKKQGTAFRVASGELKCVTGCEDISDEGYACQNPRGLSDCIPGICPGGSDNVCCRAAAGAAGGAAGCRTNADCSTGTLCAPSGECQRRCNRDEDCPGFAGGTERCAPISERGDKTCATVAERRGL